MIPERESMAEPESTQQQAQSEGPESAQQSLQSEGPDTKPICFVRCDSTIPEEQAAMLKLVPESAEKLRKGEAAPP